MFEYMIVNGEFKPLIGCSRLSNHTVLDRVIGINEMTHNLTRGELKQALMSGKKIKNANWKPNSFIRMQGGRLVNEQGQPESALTLLIDGEWTVC